MYDSKKQVENWNREYESLNTYTSTKAQSPSPAISILTDYIERNNIVNLKTALDVGSGPGRNVLSLVKRGLSVYATDIVQTALIRLQKDAIRHGYQNDVHFCLHDMTEPFPFQQHAFDLILDVTSICNVPSREALKKYIFSLAEMCNFGGYFYLVNFDASDEYYRWLIDNHKKGNYVQDPHNYILSRVFSRNEICAAVRQTLMFELKHEQICRVNSNIGDQAFKRRYRCFIWKRV